MSSIRSLPDLLQQGNLSRRRFLKTCAALTGLLGLPLALPPDRVARAAALPGSSKAPVSKSPVWKFAMISDTHDADMQHTPTGVTPYLPPIIGYIVAEHPDFVLQTGDLITGAQTLPTSPAYKQFDMQYANYKKVTAPLAQANIPLYVIRGNHDYGLYNGEPALSQSYLAVIASIMPQNGPTAAKGLSYSFVHNNAKFIMIDQFVNTAAGIVTLPMDWLKTELQNTQGAHHVFVMGHSPVYSPDTTASSKMAQFNLFDQSALQSQFWQLLIDNHATAYISGHEHLYFRGGKWAAANRDRNLGCISSYNPPLSTAVEQCVPTTPVPNTQGARLCCIHVDDGKRSITATEYWLDQNNQKHVYDTFTVIP
jgi:hypothetical protein